MKPHLVLNDEEKQQRFEIMMNFLSTLKFYLEEQECSHIHVFYHKGSLQNLFGGFFLPRGEVTID